MTHLAGEYSLNDLVKEATRAKKAVRATTKGVLYFDPPSFYPSACGMSMRLDYQVSDDQGGTTKGSYGVAL